MSYSISTLTDYYYEGTNCLINKFNIQNEEQLAKIEAGSTDYLKEIFKNHIKY